MKHPLQRSITGPKHGLAHLTPHAYAAQPARPSGGEQPSTPLPSTPDPGPGSSLIHSLKREFLIMVGLQAPTPVPHPDTPSAFHAGRWGGAPAPPLRGGAPAPPLFLNTFLKTGIPYYGRHVLQGDLLLLPDVRLVLLAHCLLLRTHLLHLRLGGHQLRQCGRRSGANRGGAAGRLSWS
jgi:hypothetical protein